MLTIETAGSCQGSANSVSMWAFLGPIIVIHVALGIVTNVILFKVKGISDRYQEQKYVALASIYICELLLLGLPILFAVQESGEARYLVMAGVIFLTDTGVLALIFLPKINYAKVGLPEGVSVIDSIGRKRRAVVGGGSNADAVSAVEEIRRRAYMQSNRNVSVLSSYSKGIHTNHSPRASVGSAEEEEKVEVENQAIRVS